MQRVSVPNSKLFETMKTDLWVKEVREFSITIYGKTGFGHQYGCRNISARRFSKL